MFLTESLVNRTYTYSMNSYFWHRWPVVLSHYAAVLWTDKWTSTTQWLAGEYISIIWMLANPFSCANGKLLWNKRCNGNVAFERKPTIPSCIITITNSISSTITEVDGSVLVTPRLQVDGVVRQSAIQNVTNWRMVSSGILIDPKTDSRHCYFASPAHSSSLRPVMPVVRRMWDMKGKRGRYCPE